MARVDGYFSQEHPFGKPCIITCMPSSHLLLTSALHPQELPNYSPRLLHTLSKQGGTCGLLYSLPALSMFMHSILYKWHCTQFWWESQVSCHLNPSSFTFRTQVAIGVFLQGGDTPIFTLVIAVTRHLDPILATKEVVESLRIGSRPKCVHGQKING